MRDRLDGIAVFIEAVDAGGFAAAAARLSLSRSAVGKAIAKLEARLGTRLFQRTTRTQSLTEDGRAYYERCRRALDEIRAAESMLESGRREATGRLRVSMPVLFGRHCIAPILVELARHHPKLDLDLSFSDRLDDLVEEGFDLAIRNGPLQDRAGLIARRVARQDMVLCAAPSYLQARGRPRTVGEIANHDAIVYRRADLVKSWLFRDGDGGTIEIVPKARLRLDDLEAITDAAAAGMGLAWLPCWLVRDRVRSGELMIILDDLPSLAFDSHALWPRTPHLPLRVRLAIDALAANLPKRMGLGTGA